MASALPTTMCGTEHRGDCYLHIRLAEISTRPQTGMFNSCHLVLHQITCTSGPTIRLPDLGVSCSLSLNGNRITCATPAWQLVSRSLPVVSSCCPCGPSRPGLAGRSCTPGSVVSVVLPPAARRPQHALTLCTLADFGSLATRAV